MYIISKFQVISITSYKNNYKNIKDKIQCQTENLCEKNISFYKNANIFAFSEPN